MASAHARRAQLADAGWCVYALDLVGFGASSQPGSAPGRTLDNRLWARQLQAFLDAGISTRRGIMAAHREPACSHIAGDALPVTEHLTDNTIILPLYHEMTAADQERVVEVLRKVGT